MGSQYEPYNYVCIYISVLSGKLLSHSLVYRHCCGFVDVLCDQTSLINKQACTTHLASKNQGHKPKMSIWSS